MKKILICLLVLLMLSGCADAKTYDTVLINSVTSDRVHLRQESSSTSNSLGLYFTGTPAIVLEEDEYWTRVMVGTEKGYIHNSLLVTYPPVSKARLAEITAKGTLNLRARPSTDAQVITRLPEGMNLLVLGETHDHWSYVKAGKLYGYVMNQYLDTDGYVSTVPGPAYVPDALLGRWVYTSGAGGWQTVLTVFPNGTFWGYYSDSDMGDTAGRYPRGTVYECTFTGHFSHVQRVNEYEYQLDVSDYHVLGTAGEERVIDKVRYVTVASAGIDLKEQCSLFLPGFSDALLSEEAWFQYHSYGVETPTAFLYDHNSQAGFIAE